MLLQLLCLQAFYCISAQDIIPRPVNSSNTSIITATAISTSSFHSSIYSTPNNATPTYSSSSASSSGLTASSISTGSGTSATFTGIPTFASMFDPSANDNLVVYFGHSTGNSNAPLADLCNDPSIDIIAIGFVRSFNGPNQPPSVDFGRHCRFSNFVPSWCMDFATDVWKCKDLGKKIFLSVGGSRSNTSFVSEQAAIDAADVLWNVFGEGTSGNLTAYRPFGELCVNGFDIGEPHLDDLDPSPEDATWRNTS